MSCESIRDRLDDLLDGEIPVGERRRIEEHLSTCLPCRREWRERQELLELARRLPPVEPERDLWPEVAERIADDGRHQARRWAAWAAAAAVAIALAAPLLLQRAAPPDDDRAAAPATPETPTGGSELARWRDGTMLTRSDLAVEIDRQRALLPSGALDHVEEDVEILDRAVAQLAAALEQDPMNRRLSALLADRYQQEAAVLQRISRI
ncbi:MAG: zf-HC2 domain-containing protein [Thermoanaerobaculia bacterium]|nr:zf-HC2 domain-containing protein [Thermoanaerobaculia bacterium]